MKHRSGLSLPAGGYAQGPGPGITLEILSSDITEPAATTATKTINEVVIAHPGNTLFPL